MSETNDLYKTLAQPGPEVLFKDRGSKFYGYAFPVQNESMIKQALEQLKTSHHQARHWCYAWQLGTDTIQYRYNDDGEPSNSAGAPIYGQIQSFELTQVLIVVVRYFGGTKLGVGGLIQAYRAAARMALEAAQIETKTIQRSLKIKFEYPKLNTVMRIIKEQDLEILDQQMELHCTMEIGMPRSTFERVLKLFQDQFQIDVIDPPNEEV